MEEERIEEQVEETKDHSGIIKAVIAGAGAVVGLIVGKVICSKLFPLSGAEEVVALETSENSESTCEETTE